MCLICDEQVVITKKEILDLRGKSFLRRVEKLADVMNKYRDLSLEKWLAYADNNIHKAEFDNTEFETRLADREEDFNLELWRGVKDGQKWQEKEIQKELSKSIGLSVDITNKYADEYVATRTGALIKDIDETTQKEIQGIIDNGIQTQQSLKEISTAIQDQFAKYPERRSLLIARQEVSMAFAYGKGKQFESYLSEFGTPGRKRAITQWDEKVRPEHTANANAWRITYSTPFPWTWDQTEPFGFNCRCVVVHQLFNPDTWSIR